MRRIIDEARVPRARTQACTYNASCATRASALSRALNKDRKFSARIHASRFCAFALHSRSVRHNRTALIRTRGDRSTGVVPSRGTRSTTAFRSVYTQPETTASAVLVQRADRLYRLDVAFHSSANNNANRTSLRLRVRIYNPSR